MRRLALSLFVAWLALIAAEARAQFSSNTVRIGVLTDLSGPFSDQVGRGSVEAAKMAAEDFAPESGGLQVQILAGDHQNKPDIGVAVARQWVDQDGVAAVADLPNSGVALAVANMMRQKNRVALASSTATSDLTGKACTPVTVQWVLDTWALGHGTVAALMRAHLESFFFLTVDYALGLALERDATEAIKAAGGQVLGSVRSPLGTADFSSPLLQAQASGAKVVALANTGADTINAVKQAAEFDIIGKGTQLSALFVQLSDIHALGLAAAQGLQVTEAFYWDLNDATRAFARRFAARMNGRMPTEDQAGVYAAVSHYLRAVRGNPTLDGDAVVAAMKRTPIHDDLFGTVAIRPDGRAIHPIYLFRVKSPAESHGEWDAYSLLQTIPADQAFRPMADGGCPLVK